MKTALFGDSGANGAGPGPGGRHPITPFMTLKARQTLFDFQIDASAGGMSFDSAINGSHAASFASIVTDASIGAVLISLGGNDNTGSAVTEAAFIQNVSAMATMLTLHNKLFCFAGIPDISVKQSWAHTGGTGDAISSGRLSVGADIARNAEVLRQLCSIRGYLYCDIRNAVAVDLQNITCDIVHPDQLYSIAIYTHIAKWIAPDHFIQ